MMFDLMLPLSIVALLLAVSVLFRLVRLAVWGSLLGLAWPGFYLRR